LYVAEHGPAEGTPTVFLHGAMVAGWMWMEQVAGLPQHRGLLPDLPGVGQSSDEEWLSFSDAAHRVAELIRARCADGSAHVVGLSLGGIVALHLAARHPSVARSLLISGVRRAQHLVQRVDQRVLARGVAQPDLQQLGPPRGRGGQGGTMARRPPVPDDLR
jgi:pimeloyl-ACP methyl ester carboxylesterase